MLTWRIMKLLGIESHPDLNKLVERIEELRSRPFVRNLSVPRKMNNCVTLRWALKPQPVAAQEHAMGL
jgi:hypothetical protein